MVCRTLVDLIMIIVGVVMMFGELNRMDKISLKNSSNE
ncbi:Uncharacterised protein [Peptoniphilus harei]|uniref:Uncharacterized protein n=1 Tax=Peptoniphilus harei TaxID=54005 RepID=A0A2X1ZYT5_9FIRM|nr:Uncharacterised protein [Peptoniphilus harei]